jgi:hypothetical protein
MCVCARFPLDDDSRLELLIAFALARFLLKDAKSGMWFDVGDVYAREKVSHALRSRPNEERSRRLKPKKKMTRKPEIPIELEGRVQALIREQQTLLKVMIEREVFPGTHFDSSKVEMDDNIN